MNRFVALLILALAAAPEPLRAAEPPQEIEIPAAHYGAYDLGEGDLLFVVAEDGRPLLGFPDGQVRGLFADPGGGYRYGPALMVDQPVGGRVFFTGGSDGLPRAVTWLPSGAAPRDGTQLPIRQEEVHFENRQLSLAGTLYLPVGAPRHPAVVLTHGSGPTPRGPGFYEYFFASRGFAVLSYDKRGVGDSGGKQWRASFADYAADALAGVRFLQARPEIRADQIGLHGPSQGGWVAPLAASMSDAVAFVIIRSANAITPRRQDSYMLGRRLRHHTDLTETEIAEALEYLDLRMDRLLGRRSQAEFKAALRAKSQTAWGKYISDRLPSRDFWRPNAEYDPEPALRKLRCPLLVLLGDADNSTPVEVNARLFDRILTDSGHRDYAVRVFPRANHGLFETETGRPLEDELPELKRLVPGRHRRSGCGGTAFALWQSPPLCSWQSAPPSYGSLCADHRPSRRPVQRTLRPRAPPTPRSQPGPAATARPSGIRQRCWVRWRPGSTPPPPRSSEAS